MNFKIKTFIQGIFIIAKGNIQKLVTAELDNADKKAELDRRVIAYIDSFPINFVVKMVIRKYIPVITQCIFDTIKTKISGVTK